MEKVIINEMLGVDLKVLCSDGLHRTVSIYGLKNNRNASISIDDDDSRIPRCKIDLHLECDGYMMEIKDE